MTLCRPPGQPLHLADCACYILTAVCCCCHRSPEDVVEFEVSLRLTGPHCLGSNSCFLTVSSTASRQHCRSVSGFTASSMSGHRCGGKEGLCVTWCCSFAAAVQVRAGFPSPHAAPHECCSRPDVPYSRAGGPGCTHVSRASSLRHYGKASALCMQLDKLKVQQCHHGHCWLTAWLTAAFTFVVARAVSGCHSPWASARTPPRACLACHWAGATSHM